MESQIDRLRYQPIVYYMPDPAWSPVNAGISEVAAATVKTVTVEEQRLVRLDGGRIFCRVFHVDMPTGLRHVAAVFPSPLQLMAPRTDDEVALMRRYIGFLQGASIEMYWATQFSYWAADASPWLWAITGPREVRDDRHNDFARLMDGDGSFHVGSTDAFEAMMQALVAGWPEGEPWRNQLRLHDLALTVRMDRGDVPADADERAE